MAKGLGRFGAVVALTMAIPLALFAAGEREQSGSSSTVATTSGAGLAYTDAIPSSFNEAPMLAELVAAGQLPPVKDRLPLEPVVIVPEEEIGQYGGTWFRSVPSPGGMMLNGRVGYEALVKWGPDGRSLAPDIAKSYEASANATSFTFFLREGMRWSDGAPFSAEDYEFYFNDILFNDELTPAIPAWLMVNGEPVRFTLIDDYSFRLDFTAPYGMFLEQLAFNGRHMSTPKHYLSGFHPAYTAKAELDKKVADAQFDEWYQLFADRNDLTTNPERPSIRPWVLRNAPPAATLFATRNAYYWKVDTAGNQLPYIDEMSVAMIEDNEIINARAAMGETTFEYQYLQFANWTMFKEGEQQNDYRVLNWRQGETGAVIFLNFNATDVGFQELVHEYDFRLGLSLAMNRDEINELVYLGMADPAWMQFIPEDEWGESHATLESRYSDLVSRYRYDPQAANEALDRAGLTARDGDGWRLRPDGKPLTIIMEPLSSGLVNLDAFELIREYWENVGVRTSIKPLSAAHWWDRIYSSEYMVAGYLNTRVKWQVYPRDWAPLRNHTYWAPLYGLWYDTGGRSGVEPPGEIREAQLTYDQIVSTPDAAEREALSKELLLTHGMNVWTIPTTSVYPAPYVAHNNFRNVPDTGYMVWSLFSPGYKAPEQFFIRQD